MKKVKILFAVGSLFLIVSSSTHAANITITSTAGSGSFLSPVTYNTDGYTSPFTTNVNTFNGLTFSSSVWEEGYALIDLDWAIQGNYQFVEGDSSQHASPNYLNPPNTKTADLSTYLSITKSINSEMYAVIDFDETPGIAYNYLGLWWGSIDTYNSITFRYDGVDLGTVSGADVPGSLVSGSWTDPRDNQYVNIFTDFYFDDIVLDSSSYAFELDNLAVANVPEPGTLLLLGLGWLGLGVAGLGRRNR